MMMFMMMTMMKMTMTMALMTMTIALMNMTVMTMTVNISMAMTGMAAMEMFAAIVMLMMHVLRDELRQITMTVALRW